MTRKGSCTRRLTGLALLVFAAGGARPVQSLDMPNLDVRSLGGRLSVHARAVPLQRILTQISRVSGVRIRLDAAGSPRRERALITIDFEALNLADGLRLLLKQENLILLYSGSGLEEARVYGPADGGSRQPTAQAFAFPSVLDVNRMARLETAREAENDDRVARLRMDALGHPDSRQRSRALEALAANTDQQTALDTVREVLERESDSAVLGRALDIAREQEGLPLDPLLKLALNGREPTVRIKALTRLSERGSQDPRVRETLGTVAAHDPAMSVRETAETLLQELAAN